MAITYLNNISLDNNEIKNFLIDKKTTTQRDAMSANAGHAIFNTTVSKFQFYNGSTWLDISGDIEQVIAGSGMTGGGASGDVTLNVVGGTGITANANDIAITDTSVTAGSYGSATAIPTFTVNAQGQLTAAGTASISTDLTISDAEGTPNTDVVSVGSDTLVFEGTANEVTTLVSNNKVTIGMPDNVTVGGNLIVSGNLTVSGTQTIVNTETINLADNIITLNSNATGSPSENAGIEVERGDSTNVALRWNETSDVWELTKDGTNYKTIQTIQESNFSASIGDGTNTGFNVDHNLGTRDVIVQLYDNSTYDTVFADVVRETVNRVTVTFAVPPTTNDIRVLVTKV